ncbi:MAG: DUF2336 domain-containing protein [Hyphomonadaceae bacterium]|nr:DUF2336 domain-containing protein [Hyphomonadaceae bacterium]
MSVQALRPKLTENDIVRLMKGETPETRASVAHRLCRRMALDVLSEPELAYAREIMSILAEDAAELVRRTMAITLRNSPIVPREIALKLSQDVESVALPVIEHSPAFTEQDLIEIVLSATAAKQSAVAGRAEVSQTLAEVIAEHAAVEAVRTLAANTGADMTEKAFADGIQRFPKDGDLHEAIIRREHVPMHIAEKMVSLVSGKMFDMLVNRHELPAQMAIDLAAGARERATIDLVDQAGRSQDLPRFVAQLNLNGRLSHSLILRALCVGHMSFVEHALAELSGVPHQRVWLMVHDAGPLGLQAVFDRAGLPRRFLEVFRAAVGVYHETEHDGAANDRTRFRMRMIERVLTQFQGLPREDVDYLLEKLDAYEETLGARDSDAA